MDLNAEQVRAKARAARSLASQLGGVQLARPMEQVAGALPGARAEQAASRLGGTWAERVRNLAADVVAHAEALRSSVDRMQAVDDSQRDCLERYRAWSPTGSTWRRGGDAPGPGSSVPFPGGGGPAAGSDGGSG